MVILLDSCKFAIFLAFWYNTYVSKGALMTTLSDEQLNSLSKDALILIVASLQTQLEVLQSQLDSANSMLSDNNRQIELLTEQIKLMNQRH